VMEKERNDVYVTEREVREKVRVKEADERVGENVV